MAGGDGADGAVTPMDCWGRGRVRWGWSEASPGRLPPTIRAAFPARLDGGGGGGGSVSGSQGLPGGGARGRETPPCLCGSWKGRAHPLAGDHQALLPLLSPALEGSGNGVGSGGAHGGGGGGMVAHLLAPQLVVVRVVCAWCSGPGQEAWEPHVEPLQGTGGGGGQGPPPPGHRDMLPGSPTTAKGRCGARRGRE